jgi:hypothetical protein
MIIQEVVLSWSYACMMHRYIFSLVVVKATRGNKTMRSKTKKNTKRTFSSKDYHSGDGFVTSTWGPSVWHALHTMSFNYPVNPTEEQKHQYRDFVLSLRNVLPCKYCRQNLTNNLKAHPLKMCHMKDRDSFSRFIYNLHEVVNKMLGKKSGLSYCDVRERYENFRSRCTLDEQKKQAKLFDFSKDMKKTQKKKETGCTEPLYGKKAKCVIKIVPQDEKVPSFQIDDKCIKKRRDLPKIMAEHENEMKEASASTTTTK